MSREKSRFVMLRKLLGAIGLSPEASDEIVNKIIDLLSDKETAKKREYPYFLSRFLSPAEISFYHVLRNGVSEWAVICPKVRLGDIFYAKTGDRGKTTGYRNRIDRKHIDFLLCDPKTMVPILGIELDDKSHQRKDRQARDNLVNNVFKAAKLPLARIPVKYSYDVKKVEKYLKGMVDKKEEQLSPLATVKNASVLENETPNCPKCDKQMVLRTVKRGENKGNQFWGCIDYPSCRGIVRQK